MVLCRFGKNVLIILAFLLAHPDPPSNLQQSISREPWSATINVALPPNKGNSRIYEIHFSYTLTNGTVVNRTVGGDTLSYTMTNLIPYTSYVVNVTLKNQFLFSKPATIIVKTSEASRFYITSYSLFFMVMQ